MTQRAYYKVYQKKHKKELRVYRAGYYKKNRKKILAKSRAWAVKNPHRRKLIRRRWYKKLKKDPRRMQTKSLQERYGIGFQEFSAMRKKQKNCCEICRKKFDRTPHVDHSHATGKVRGLLCTVCNTGLGFFKDSKILLRSAANYLTRKEKL